MREFDFNCDEITPLLTQRFWAGVEVRGADDCWEWQKAKRGKYGVFRYCKKLVPTHRLSFVLSNGLLPLDRIVGHRCDNPSCCNPAHLEAITYSQNSKDAHARGKLDGTPHGQIRGEAMHNAVLCNADILKIIGLRESGFGFKKIAKILGVSSDSVRAVVDGKTWTHITGGKIPRKQ